MKQKNLNSFKVFSMTALLAVSLSGCAAQVPLSATRSGLVAGASKNLQASAANSPGGPVSLPVHLKIKRAEIEVSTAELNKQFKSILALSNEQRLREPVLSTLDGHVLQLTGKVKPVSFAPEILFKVTGDLTVRPGNVLRFSPTDIRVVGIPFKGLMDLIGLELANLAKFKDRWGRVVQAGNDIDLVIEKFTQDAVIEGQMKEVKTAISGVTVIF